VPGALHLEVGVQGGAGVGAQQQVLAAGGDLADDLAAEVGGGEPGDAEVGSHQSLAGQGGVHAGGGQKDRVPLRHRRRLVP
jgi:hypothetical protein